MFLKIKFRHLIVVSIGMMIGLPLSTGVVTFFYAEGFSYLSSSPKACINCHVMQEQYDAWKNSSHRAVANCNDCHSHGNVIEKYSQKAVNGFLHSAAFTTGWFHEPIQIKGFNSAITKKTCVSCHSNLIEASRFSHSTFENNNCLTCHREVGHRKW